MKISIIYIFFFSKLLFYLRIGCRKIRKNITDIWNDGNEGEYVRCRESEERRLHQTLKKLAFKLLECLHEEI